jgi:hypothetical protein
VCETFTDLNDPARGENVHKIFMDKVPDDINQVTPSQWDSCAFPFFGSIGVPLMVTLYIPRLNVGLPVWLGTIPIVSNSLDAYQLRTLCHGNHVDVASSTMSSPPPSSFSGESIATSNRKSKRNRKRNNKKKKSPTFASHVGYRSSKYASHVGDRSSNYASHVEDQHPAFASHVGGKHPASASHAGGKQPTSASLVRDSSSTSASHVKDQHLAFASHTGEKFQSLLVILTIVL